MEQNMFAFPSGKSMEEPTLEIFGKANIKISRNHPRECLATVSGLPGIVRAAFLKPSVIGEYVRRGSFVAGITARDSLIESAISEDVVVVTAIPYSRASNGGTRCVLIYRQTFGFPDWELELKASRKLVVISEYPEATKRFFEALKATGKLLAGAEVDVVACPGSAEALVMSGIYDWGVVLVETGTSLKVNGLKETMTIFESETVLIANRAAYTANASLRESLDFLGKLLVGVVEAREHLYLTMNAPLAAVDGIKEILPSLKSPTVQPLLNQGYCSVSSVVPSKDVNAIKMKLAALGASGFVELNPDSVM